LVVTGKVVGGVFELLVDAIEFKGNSAAPRLGGQSLIHGVCIATVGARLVRLGVKVDVLGGKHLKHGFVDSVRRKAGEVPKAHEGARKVLLASSLVPEVGHVLLLSNKVDSDAGVLDNSRKLEVECGVVETHHGAVGHVLDVVVLVVAHPKAFALVYAEVITGAFEVVGSGLQRVKLGAVVATVGVVDVERYGVVSEDGEVARSCEDGGLRLVGSVLVDLKLANELSILDDTPLVRGRLCASLSKLARAAGLRKLAIRSPRRILPSISLSRSSSDIGHFLYYVKIKKSWSITLGLYVFLALPTVPPKKTIKLWESLGGLGTKLFFTFLGLLNPQNFLQGHLIEYLLSELVVVKLPYLPPVHACA